MQKIRKLLSYCKKYAPFACVFIFTFLLLSFLGFGTFAVSNSTDSSWQYSLSGLRHSSQGLGTDVFFTYGPLFEKMPTIVHARDSLKNFMVGNVLYLLILCASTWVFWRAYSILKVNLGKIAPFVLAVVAVALLLTIADIDTAFGVLLLAALFAARNEKSYWLKLLALSGVYLFAFYKLSFLIPLILLTPLVFIENLHWKKIVKGFALSGGPLLVCWSMFALLGGSLSPGAFFSFFHIGIVNTLAYGEFMGLPFADYRSLIISYTAFFGLIILSSIVALIVAIRRKGFIKSSEFLIANAAFLAVIYFDFKHAVVRNDIHLLSFTPFLFLGSVLLCINVASLSRKLREKAVTIAAPLVLVLGVVAVIAHVVILSTLIMMPLAVTADAYRTQRVNTFKLAIADSRLDYNYFLKNRSLSAESIRMRAEDIQGIRTQLNNLHPKGQPLLFYGNTTLYGDVLQDDYTVLYPPLLQNYVAYPPQLTDDLYIQFLDNHPDALVFAEEREASIDKRIPAHELNKFFQYLTHNYKIVLQDIDRGQFVFQRVSGNKETCENLAQVSFRDGARVAIPILPLPHPTQYVKFTLKPSPEPIESLLSLLLKNPVYTLSLITPEGVNMDVRTTRTTLEHGVSIHPFHQSLRGFAADQPFDMKTFIVHNGLPKASNYSANFQLCTFVDTN